MRRDLSTIDRDIGQDWSRIIQEAFAHGITNDLIYGGLLTGQTSVQGLHVKQTTKNCLLGTRRVKWDGRVFRYGKCGAVSLETMKNFACNASRLVVENDSVVGAAAAGAIELTLTVIQGSIGSGQNGIIAKDELVGGYISLYNSSIVRDQRMIIGNTALASDGTSITLTIEDGISLLISDGTSCEVCANPYLDLQQQYGGFVAAMGLPCVLAETDDFFWLQTWGIARVNATQAYALGQRAFWVKNTYSAQMQPEGGYDGTMINRQYVGFIVERTVGSPGDGAPFLMLQISP